ncbi:unnamed protein product, partial [Mesorhabditis spiculigera]
MADEVVETKMAPEFWMHMERIQGYKTSLDMLVARMEGVMQRNPDVLKKSEAALLTRAPPPTKEKGTPATPADAMRRKSMEKSQERNTKTKKTKRKKSNGDLAMGGGGMGRASGSRRKKGDAGSVVCPNNDCPYDGLADQLYRFAGHVDKPTQPIIRKLSEAYRELAKAERVHQYRLGQDLRDLYGYKDKEYATLFVEKERLEASRVKMDLARHDVKMCTKVDQVEKMGFLYEQSVSVFEENCNKVTKMMESMADCKKLHQTNVVGSINTIQTYHDDSCQIFAKGKFK